MNSPAIFSLRHLALRARASRRRRACGSCGRACRRPSRPSPAPSRCETPTPPVTSSASANWRSRSPANWRSRSARSRGFILPAIVHDVGKIEIPSDILSKPGTLSQLQMQLVRGHVQAGYDIIKGIDFPWPIAQMVLQHHERLDGSGYPNGVMGDAILPEAKILVVADVVEAMMSHRPYRAGLGPEVALAEIEKGAGRLYDNEAVQACLMLFRERGLRFD